MKIPHKTAWMLFFLYVGLVYGGLYFTPDIGNYLKEKEELEPFINWAYTLAGLALFVFFYFKLKIRSPETYGMALALIILFFAAFGRMEISTDRLHFLEHGLLYLLAHLALRFSKSGIILIGRTILLCSFIALGDEAIQGWLPNREADWNDLWTNVFSYYLAAGFVGIAKPSNPMTMEKRDNIALIGTIIAMVFWLKYAQSIPSQYSFLYLLLFAVLFLPFFYFLHLKRAIYGWSFEAVLYLFLLTLVGVISFSHSILGLKPGRVIAALYQSGLLFFRSGT